MDLSQKNPPIREVNSNSASKGYSSNKSQFQSTFKYQYPIESQYYPIYSKKRMSMNNQSILSNLSPPSKKQTPEMIDPNMTKNLKCSITTMIRSSIKIKDQKVKILVFKLPSINNRSIYKPFKTKNPSKRAQAQSNNNNNNNNFSHLAHNHKSSSLSNPINNNKYQPPKAEQTDHSMESPSLLMSPNSEQLPIVAIRPIPFTMIEQGIKSAKLCPP